MDISESERLPVAEAMPIARRIYRHRLPVRLMHWINVVCLVVMLGSGLNIFNAHPTLYWGNDSVTGTPWLSMRGENTAAGPVGKTRLGSTDFTTTGVLGMSKVEGQATSRGFPSWATIPGTQWLAAARNWHLFFAWLFVINGVCYVAYTVFSRHLVRDLIPTRDELKNIGRSILDHVKFKHRTGDAAKRYDVLQSLAYLVVIFGLLPLVVVCGLALSPRLNTVFTGWVDLLGGRQSARSLHFLAAAGLVLFVIVHVAQVFIAGVWNEMRSIITGWYRIPEDHPKQEVRP